MKNLFIYALSFMSILGFSQAEASHWYFGDGAGIIFDLETGTVTSTNAAQNTIDTFEGCSSISDFNGNLLFYTDGRNVWDKNYSIMPNANYSLGTGLMGDPSSTSSGLIVPKPGNPNEYYVFTVDEPHHQNSFAFPNQGPADEFGISTEFYTNPFGSVPEDDDGFNNGLAYSLVDLTLNNGNGDVVTSEKNIQLLTYNPNEQEEESYKCAEKITAVEHSDKQSYWVITHFIDNFYAFRVDSNGVETTPVITNINPLISTSGYRRNGIGYIKASPDGSKIAICHSQNGNQAGGNSDNGSTWIYDFDNSSGILSNPLNLVSNVSQYGVEFSPDSSKLYTSGGGTVLQFDLDAVNPELSFFELAFGFSFFGALQLGPDGKIYVANNEDPFSLDVINFPNELGVDAGYNAYQMNLSSGSSGLGLPPFIQSFFLASIQFENSCVDINTEFSVNSTQAYDSILWDFGDGTDTSTENAPSHTYTSAGTYTVSAEITAGTEVSTFSETIIISSNPIANLADDIDICDDDNDGVMSFDFVAPQTQVLAEQDPTEFTVSYHLSQDDADTNSGALSLPYQNTNSSEEIFVRIENNANTACYDTTSFTLTVFEAPVANIVETFEICDDGDDGDDANGQAEVTLTDFDAIVLDTQDSTLFSVSYHLSQGDADANTAALTSPYYNAGAAFTYPVFARIQNNLNTDCYATTEFTVNIYKTPTANLADDIDICDDDNDGVMSFDFVAPQTQVLAEQDPTEFTVSYHLSQDDADTNSGALSLPYQNTNSSEEIFVRIENNANTACYDTTSFTLTVFEAPVANIVETFEICDDGDDGDDANGQAEVTLTDFDAIVLDTQDSTLFSVSYHLSQGDADANTAALTSPYYNAGAAFTYPVFARIQNNLNTDCYATTEFTVNIYKTPTANLADDIDICDDDNDGVMSFDFVAPQTQVLAEQDPTEFTVSYHLSQDDADTNSGALSLPYQNTNSSEEIFVRIENNANTACYDTTSFTLTVFEAPVANIVETFEICDDGDDGDDANGQAEVTLTDFDAIVLDTQDSTLFSVSYHLSQGDADANTAALTSPYYNAGAAFTYPVFARIQNNLNTDCYATTEFTVNIYKTPTANLADDIDICDDDNDGVMSFDFVAPQTQVLAEQDPTEFTVSYHLSQDDADTNSGALSLPYQNTNSSEEIFVRIENNANTACYDTTSFIINIFNTPVIPQGIQYNLCDYTNPGNLTEVFDLLSLNAEIINGQDVTISHHLSFEDAENGVGAITDPYTNTSPNQVIFVLLENNAYTGCRSIGTYNIIVDPLPDLITNVPLVQCDIDDIQDGISIYNLEEAAENIIIGDDANNYTLSFHLSQEDLDANIGAIADPTSFVNTSPLQTIFTRVENIATTCYSTSFFYLETIFNPIPGDAGLIVCDNSEMNGNDYDGLGLFTLSDANEYILSLIVANPNNDITDADQLDVAYYSSETDALLELGQLPDQYISEVADSQTVFVRIERGNDCFGINTMLLEVIPVPELNEIPDEILCSDNPGIAEVFLTDYDAIVLGSQSANDVIISYHATQQDADLGIGALASPYTVTNQQTIFVREEVQNNDPNQTGCYITNVNFTLTVEPNPSVNIPTPQVLCDDDFDGLQTFDLNGVDIEIIGGQTDMVVSYYTNQNDADSASNPVGDVFQTTQEDTQTLIFRIENITTGCYSTGNLELIVNPLPVLQPLDNFATCDDNVETDNDTSNDSVEFDLLSQNTAVLNGQDPTIFEVSYHLSQIDADQGINALVSPYTNTSNPQTIFTRVRNTLTDCFNTVPLVLQVNPLPVVNLDEDYLLCVNTNGTEILDPLVIYSNLSATDFSFIWSNANGDVLGTDPDFEPIQGGVYNLEVFDALLPTQCAAPVETFIVIESSPPDVTAEVTSEPFASTHVIQSTGTGQGIYEFSLDQGPWGDSGLFVGVKPGEHIVSVRDLNGCGTVSVPLLVIDYPKFFTPNQDGYNDTWNITALENQPNSKIYIFDRYGKFLKQISTSGIGWDGTYNGAQMPSTDYWFKLEYTDLDTGNLKIFKAHFSLKR